MHILSMSAEVTASPYFYGHRETGLAAKTWRGPDRTAQISTNCSPLESYTGVTAQHRNELQRQGLSRQLYEDKGVKNTPRG